MVRKLLQIPAIGLACMLAFGACAKSDDPSAKKTSTQKAAVGNLVLGLTSDGTVALPTTGMNFEVEGIISKLYVAAGDTVKEGDLLAELEDDSYQISVTNAQNSLNKAESNYEDIQKQHEYSLLSSEQNLESLRSQINSVFDDSGYQNSINDAQSALSKKMSELNELKQAAGPLKDHTYNSSVSEAKIALERKKSDLDAAHELSFDASSYQSAVDSAAETLNDAKDSLKKVEETEGSSFEEWESATKTAANAQKSYDNAVDSYNKAKADFDKQKTEKIKTAQQAVDDAERSKKTAVENADKKLAEAETAVKEAEESLARAKSNLEKARKEFTDNKASTQATYDLQSMNYENSADSTQSITDAFYAIEDAKLKLQEAENNLAKTKLYAGMDGQIINVTKGVGEKATASVGGPMIDFGTGDSNSNFITLCDISEIYLTSNVSEGDIVGLKVDQVVNVTVDSIGETVFKGKVANISNIPTTDSNGITTYKVTVKLDELSTDIRDGMNALLNFVKKELENVLLIPVKSVFIEDGQQYVNVVSSDGSYEKRAVTTGLSNGTQTQVLAGLEAGETVVVGKVAS